VGFRTAALAVVLVALSPAVTAAAADASSDSSIRLTVPKQARPPAVRVLVELRDCSARPTVTIVARWRRAPGRAVLRVSGIERVLRRSPRPATRRTDRIVYHRVPRGTAIRATLITTWREATPGQTSCELHLPVLIGTGDEASAAARGQVRLRTPLPVTAVEEPPQRGTRLDHIWTCGGARRGDFDCGQTVTVGSQEAASVGEPDKKECKDEDEDDGDDDENSDENGDNCDDEDEDDMDTLEAAVLALLGLLGAGGIAAAAVNRPKEEGEVPPTWDQIARNEYAKPEEPVGARAGFITKVGAPTAALLTSLAAALGGLTVDAPAGHKIIAVAIVVAVSIGGVLYVFATDFRARAAVAVARFESLAKHVATEATAKPAAPADPPAPTPEPAPPTTVVPLVGVHARYAGLPTTLYAVESAGTNVVRYLLRDAVGAPRWVAADEVEEIGGPPPPS
jgi:hypothetical protein